MSDEPKYTLEERNGQMVRVYPDGQIRTADGTRFVTTPPAGIETRLTPERAREIRQQQRDQALIAQMRGLAQGTGVELPEDDADLLALVRSASSGVEALTAHMAEVFLTSRNVRGLAEAYKELTRPMLGDPERNSPPVIQIGQMTVVQARIQEQIWRDMMTARDADILEGEEK